MNRCRQCFSEDIHSPTCNQSGKVLPEKVFLVPVKWAAKQPEYPTVAVGLTMNYKCRCGATGRGDLVWVVSKVRRCPETGISGIHLWEVVGRPLVPDEVMPKYPTFQTYGYEGKGEGNWRRVR